MKKKKSKHDMSHRKLEDKEKEKMVESIVDVSSRQLGYPLPEDVCHDGVLDFVRLAIVFNRVTDIEVDMGTFIGMPTPGMNIFIRKIFWRYWMPNG